MTTPAAYAWRIDVDHLADAATAEARPGTSGPRNTAPELAHRLDTGAGLRFEMYDDDGEHYYSGRIVGTFEGDEPLIDYGRPNAGATLITYPDAPHYDSEA